MGQASRTQVRCDQCGLIRGGWLRVDNDILLMLVIRISLACIDYSLLGANDTCISRRIVRLKSLRIMRSVLTESAYLEVLLNNHCGFVDR